MAMTEYVQRASLRLGWCYSGILKIVVLILGLMAMIADEICQNLLV